MSGQLFVFSGPSGTGKSTIVSALREKVDGLWYSISHTSRRPRGMEKKGIDYHFVDRKTFEDMIDSGAFVEWAKVYDDYYGTSFASINEQTDSGLDVLLDVDVQGARNLKDHFADTVLIYVLPPSLEILESRLKARGTNSDSVVRMRLEKASREIKNCLWYNYIIINDELERSIEEAQAIVSAERCRTIRRKPTIKKLFGNSFAL